MMTYQILFVVLLNILRVQAASEFQVRELPMGGGSVSGNIPASNVSDTPTYSSYSYFRTYVPKNATSVTITAQNTGGEFNFCNVQLSVRTVGLPCPYDAPYFTNSNTDSSHYDVYAPCTRDMFTIETDETDPRSWTFSLSQGGDTISFVTDTYWYIGVGKVYTTLGSYACPFSLSVSSVVSNGTNSTVQDWTHRIPQTSEPFTQSLSNFSGLFEFVVEIPENVGTFTVTANLTTPGENNYIDIYARYGVPFTGYGQSDIEASHWSATTLNVSAPRAGLLYIQLNSYGNGIDTVTTSYLLCTPPNIGPGCMGILHNDSDLGPFTRPGGSYDYWQVPPHVINTTFWFNLSVASMVEEQSWLMVQTNIYPSTDTITEEEEYVVAEFGPSAVQVNLYPQDFITGDTWYMGVYTPDGHTFSVNFGTTPFQVPSLPGASTSTTSTSSTGHSTSSSGSTNGGSGSGSSTSVPSSSSPSTTGAPISSGASHLVVTIGVVLLAVFAIVL